jgi:predicted CopG family antitoxin
MAFTTISVRDDVARRLKEAKTTGESYSDMLERLLDNQPAETVGEWLASLKPLEGRGAFSAEERRRLKRDQQNPRRSPRRRRAAP